MSGPDHALWFTEQLAGKIGPISVGGTVTEFPTPTPGSTPEAVTEGPDRALWFTEEAGNRVGRVDAAPSNLGQCLHGGWRHHPQFRTLRSCVLFVVVQRLHG